MAENDIMLLRRFSTKADADAFAELVRRHARLVYATAWRVLRQESDAADITQQTFFELTRRAGQISGSLGGWLHKVATQKSIDLVRRSAHRRQREQVYAQTQPVEVQTWEDLSPHVDRALDGLDEPLKALLLEHFLAGKTTSQIARERRVSQATVSRRINDGLQQLRGTLKRQGLLVAAAALGTMLMENTSRAVPAPVLTELYKMAMVGTTGTAAGVGHAAVAALKANAVKVVLATAAGAGIVAVGSYLYYSRPSATPRSSSVPSRVASEAASRGDDGLSQSTAGPTTSPDSLRGGVAVTGVPSVGPEPPGAEPPTGAPGSTPKTGVTAGAVPTVGVAGQTNALSLGAAEALMHGFLGQLHEEAMDSLAGYFTEEAAADVINSSYLHSLGSPCGIIDIGWSDGGARILWSATVRAACHLGGKKRSAGESLTLQAHLVPAHGVWKLSSISLAPEEQGTK
jgi:RNA polymerase sigma factor (sigma-70 family)